MVNHKRHIFFVDKNVFTILLVFHLLIWQGNFQKPFSIWSKCDLQDDFDNDDDDSDIIEDLFAAGGSTSDGSSLAAKLNFGEGCLQIDPSEQQTI